MKLIVCMLLLFVMSPVLWAAPATTPTVAVADQTQSSASQEQAADGGGNSAEVMQAFTSNEVAESKIVAIEDKTKRLIMFFMGVPLLILLIATTALGVAMGVYGKRVFLPHMICAGLSVTLAMAHAVVGIVWFYPF